MPEEEYCHHLKLLNHQLFKAKSWIKVIGSLFILIAWVTVVALLTKRGHLLKLTKSIKSSLILYLLQVITQVSCLTARLISTGSLIPDTPKHFIYGFSQSKFPIALLTTLFALNHWIFCWHYFQAACLLKLSFGDRTIENLYRL